MCTAGSSVPVTCPTPVSCCLPCSRSVEKPWRCAPSSFRPPHAPTQASVCCPFRARPSAGTRHAAFTAPGVLRWCCLCPVLPQCSAPHSTARASAELESECPPLPPRAPWGLPASRRQEPQSTGPPSPTPSLRERPRHTSAPRAISGSLLIFPRAPRATAPGPRPLCALLFLRLFTSF